MLLYHRKQLSKFRFLKNQPWSIYGSNSVFRCSFEVVQCFFPNHIIKMSTKKNTCQQSRIKQIKSTFSFLVNLLTSSLAKYVHQSSIFFFFFFLFPGDGIYKIKYCMDECNPLNGLWTHSSRECYKFTTECQILHLDL